MWHDFKDSRRFNEQFALITQIYLRNILLMLFFFISGTKSHWLEIEKSRNIREVIAVLCSLTQITMHHYTTMRNVYRTNKKSFWQFNSPVHNMLMHNLAVLRYDYGFYCHLISSDCCLIAVIAILTFIFALLVIH